MGSLLRLSNSNAIGGLCFVTFQRVGVTSERKVLCVLCMSITECPNMLDRSPGAHLAWCLATKWHCEYLELANGKLGESRIFYRWLGAVLVKRNFLAPL